MAHNPIGTLLGGRASSSGMDALGVSKSGSERSFL